jgi:hypothetical protein
MSEYTFTLTRDQYETLLLALGTAAGAAHGQGNEELFVAFLRLANKINTNNPNWKPYELPPERKDDAEIQS